MPDHSSFEASRRSVIRGGAVGAGALIGALGLGVGQAAAATPAVGSLGADPGRVPAVDAVAASLSGDRMFMKLDGIPGDSQYKGYEDWIELADFSCGATNTSRLNSGGGAGAGKPEPLDVLFTCPTSKASPLLFKSTVMGRHIKSGQIVVTQRSQRGMTPFLKYDLTDILIDFYKIETPATTRPVDSVSLVFKTIKMTYTPQDAKGSAGDPVIFEWDVKTSQTA